MKLNEMLYQQLITNVKYKILPAESFILWIGKNQIHEKVPQAREFFLYWCY